MGRFELIPAIDLLDGRCVRLAQGNYDAATVYEDDPGATAARFASIVAAAPPAVDGGSSVRWLHVVDLDGAKQGRPANTDAVRAILAAADGFSVELGGGIRELSTIEEWFELGVARVILGTAALRDPELVREAAGRFPDRIVVGIDARDGRVAVSGWIETSEIVAVSLAKRFEEVGVTALIYTDIARDGMGTGPNLEATAQLAEAVSVPVIASGGVGSEDHVREALAFADRGVAGLIVGRALYTGAVDLGRALEIAACS